MKDFVLDSDSALAPQRQIMQILRARIAKRIYDVGDQLPTDLQLMEEFGVGRHSVRTAVQSLVSQGLVRRFPGRGSYVLKQQDKDDSWSLRSLDDVLGSKYSTEVELLSRDLVPCRAHLSQAIALGLPMKQRMLRLVMTRSMQGTPGLVSEVFLPRQFGDMLPANLQTQLKKHKLISIVMKSCRIRVERLRQSTAAMPAPDWVAKALRITPGSPVLVIARKYFDAADCAIQVGDLYCNSALYEINVDFYRAKSGDDEDEM